MLVERCTVTSLWLVAQAEGGAQRESDYFDADGTVRPGRTVHGHHTTVWCRNESTAKQLVKMSSSDG